MKQRGTVFCSIGCFFVRANINDLHGNGFLLGRPNGNVGGLSFFQVAVMSIAIQL
jgi:hypothetical protein